MGWAVHALVCIHGALPLPWLGGDEARDTRRTLLAHQLGYLRDLARKYPGTKIVRKAVWDRPLHEAIIRETLRCEPRLVMKDTHYHSTISRAFVTNTDWHLIRDCPAPLWLVRGADWPRKPTLVACVDPLHENDKPADLDHRILALTCGIAERTHGEAHALHCHDPYALVTAAAAAALPGAAGDIENLAADLQAEHAAKLNELAAAHALPPERVHFRSGSPAEGIPAAIRQLNGDLAVLGAVARSGLAHVFVGSTAERLVDELPCDVLVVKPRHFESPAVYRPQAEDFMELEEVA